MVKVVVVGSGPAGLWAARCAAECGAKVILLEARPRLGAKLLVSGAGKCNFTNILDAESLAMKFGANWRFMLPALKAMPPKKFILFLRESGVPAKLVDDFYYFPESDSALDILNALKHSKVEYQCNTPAETLLWESGRVRGVRCSSGEEFAANSVIVCCGGASYPQLGNVRKILYALPEQAGHRIKPVYPGLVGLKLKEKFLSTLSGLVLDEALLSIKKLKSSGTLLFTHSGISGPAVLDISAQISKLVAEQGEVACTLSWFAGMDEAKWNEFWENARKSNGKKLVSTVLGERITAKSAKLLLELADVPAEVIVCELKGVDRRKLVGFLSGTPLSIIGNDGWEKAMVTSGGVDLREINSGTLESKLIKGLFFAGEVVDLDGPCGGYNIQWASSSGALAGRMAANENC